MKKHISILLLTMSTSAFAQEGRVGINTTSPKTTMDVSGKTTNQDGSGTVQATDMTGLQAPRLTRQELSDKGDSLYGADQKGALVYITDVSGGSAASQRVNVTETGYYYFDGLVWVKFPAKYVEPWNLAGTTTPATDNTQDIYQMGRIGIGNSNPTSGIHILNDYGNKFDNTLDDIHIESYCGDNLITGYPNIYTSQARGTAENPKNLQFNDDLFLLGGRSRHNNVFEFSSYIQGKYRGDGNNNLSNLIFSTSFSNKMIFDEYGNLGINTMTPNAKLHVVKVAGELTPAIIDGCNEYLDNAAATTAGLPIGALYRTGDVLKVVH